MPLVYWNLDRDGVEFHSAASCQAEEEEQCHSAAHSS